MGFIDPQVLKPIEPADGVRLRTAHGERIMLSRVSMEENALVPLHSHPHEQAGMVMLGRLELTIGSETKVLEAGDLYIVPGDTPHSAVAIGGACEVLDVFSPIREDYAERQSAFFGKEGES